jgi:uncharacterized membrane protein YfcA
VIQLLLFVAAFFAGVMNAMAGGGSFITLPALILAGLNPLAANITSTVALFPGQISTGLTGHKFVAGINGMSFARLFAISLFGGVLGAWLLLATPESVFARLIPFLVLFATAVFAWGGFRRKPVDAGHAAALGPVATAAVQFAIAIYGGYFGGGSGFLMLAALALAGQATRASVATKNALAGAMNAAAVVVFMFSPDVYWIPAAVVCVAAILGGQVGAWAVTRVNEFALRIAIVLLGVALTIGLFLRA